MANTGRIRSIIDHDDPNRSVSYGYDRLQRLTSADTSGDWGLSWTYDRYGNRLSQNAVQGTPPTYSTVVDASTNRVTGHLYDAAGNVLDDGRHSYAYDANDKITSLDGAATVYRYDGQGQRVVKITGGVTTYWFFEHEYDGASWTRLSVGLGAAGKVEYVAGTTRFYHGDHLGSPAKATDVNGVEIGEWRSYPFGETWIESGLLNEDRFTGHRRDAESGNEYAAFRYYASNEGRWLGVDLLIGSPKHPQSLNRYAYAYDDPVNYVDRDGAYPCRPGIIACPRVIQIVLAPIGLGFVSEHRQAGEGGGGPLSSGGRGGASLVPRPPNITRIIKKLRKRALKKL